MIPANANRGIKRKLTHEDVFSHDPVTFRPPKRRLSPFLNTPKQRKDDRRQVMRVSAAKLRAIDNPEAFLRRSVLINNQFKKLRKEVINEKQNGYKSCGYKYAIRDFDPVSVNRCPPPEAALPCPSPDVGAAQNQTDAVNNYLPYANGLNICDNQSDSTHIKVGDDLYGFPVGSKLSTCEAEPGNSITPVKCDTSLSESQLTNHVELLDKARNQSSTNTQQQNADHERQMDVLFDKLFNTITEAVATY